MARREISRDLVAGSWDAVAPDNFRYTFATLDQALGYVGTAGLLSFDQVYAVIRVRFRDDAPERPKTKRRSWGNLSPTTQRDYEGSAAAQAEAAYHDMSVRDWYEVAPDILAFRRHARGRVPSEGTTQFREEFQVFIARKYKGLSQGERVAMSGAVAAAWAARAGR